MSDTESGTNRRVFLAAVAGASGVLAAAAVGDSAVAQKLDAKPAQGEWNLAWVDRVARAKHRMVFDATEVEFGTALINAFFFLRDYNSIYKTPDAEAGAVLVVRHEALPIVFGDAIWARLNLGEATKVKDPATGENALRNPFANVKPDEKTVLFDRAAAVDAFMARGGTVLCCNMALMRYAGMLAKQANISPDQARAQLVASLVPGTILMPSGIFAVARAQEAGCHYLRST